MRVIVCDSYDEMSKKAARIVAGQINVKPNSVLGFATGSTPIGTYKSLIQMNIDGEIDFSEVISFNLDEYYPIKQDNHQSYRYFMDQNLFNHINIPMENTHIPNGETTNPKEECENYEKAISDSGGIDLQILGIGENGHIGFNEPDAKLDSFTHLTDLTESTILANSRFFGEDEIMPTKALTMGIATILNAKKIVLLASGANKSRVVAELLNNDIDTSIPASMLKTHHDVVLICDKDAYLGARLGVSISGDSIQYTVIDNAQIVFKDTVKTPDSEIEIINAIINIYESEKDRFNIKTLGIGTPGLIKNGKVSTINLPFKETPLRKLLRERIRIPIMIDNNANCAVLGENKYGVAQGCDNVLFIKIGTGIGGGVIMNGQICRGKNSMGEIGHIIVEATNGRPCPCGQSGCWERYVSEKALISDMKKAAKENKSSLLGQIYQKNIDIFGLTKVFEAINNGCPVANEVFEKYVDYLAAGICSLSKVFDPDTIVLSGKITVQEKLLILLKRKLNTNIMIEISKLQNDAGAIGAAML